VVTTREAESRRDAVLRPRPAYARLLQRAAFAVVFWPFLRLVLRLRVRGREHLPALGPFVIVSNHVSHLDTLSLLSLFRGPGLDRVRPVAAQDYWYRHPTLLWAGRTFFNILPIVRERPTRIDDPLARMVRALEQGTVLIMFPEGTRGSGTGTAPFKSGVAHLIETMPSIPVVPVWMMNTGRSLPKGAFLPRPVACEVRIGPPVRLEGSREDKLRGLESAVRALGAGA
jgi:1-acyl-sn-glycerol-3-phosphate acyltransferase